VCESDARPFTEHTKSSGMQLVAQRSAEVEVSGRRWGFRRWGAFSPSWFGRPRTVASKFGALVASTVRPLGMLFARAWSLMREMHEQLFVLLRGERGFGGGARGGEEADAATSDGDLFMPSSSTEVDTEVRDDTAVRDGTEYVVDADPDIGAMADEDGGGACPSGYYGVESWFVLTTSYPRLCSHPLFRHNVDLSWVAQVFEDGDGVCGTAAESTTGVAAENGEGGEGEHHEAGGEPGQGRGSAEVAAEADPKVPELQTPTQAELEATSPNPPRPLPPPSILRDPGKVSSEQLEAAAGQDGSYGGQVRFFFVTWLFGRGCFVLHEGVRVVLMVAFIRAFMLCLVELFGSGGSIRWWGWGGLRPRSPLVGFVVLAAAAAAGPSKL